MAIGTFTLTGQFLGITGIPATGSVHIDGNPQTIVDPAGNKFKVGPRDEKLDIQGAFSITLPSDSTTGNSTGIAYRVTVNLRHQNLPPINLYARAIGSTVDLADIASVAIPELTVLPAGPKGDPGTPGTPGATGAQGPQGLPGVNAVPADSAVAAYVAGPSATKDALFSTLAAPTALAQKVRAEILARSKDTLPGAFVGATGAASSTTVIAGASDEFAYDSAAGRVNPNIRVSRCVPIQAGPSFPKSDAVASSGLTSDTGSLTPAYEFLFTGANEFEVLHLGTSSTIQVWADGVYVGTVPASATSDGARYRTYVKLPDTRTRLIRLLASGTSLFRGIAHTSAASLSYPVTPKGPRIIFAGDSYTEGANASNAFRTYTSVVSQALNAVDVWRSGVGGTGYLYPGATGTRVALVTRNANDVTSKSPDIVVYAMGINDQTNNTTSAIVSAATTCWDAALALPNVQVVVIGPWWPRTVDTGTTGGANIAALNTALKAAAASRGIYYVDPIGEQWITDANKATYISSDGTHPNDDGHFYHGCLVAAHLQRYFASTGPVTSLNRFVAPTLTGGANPVSAPTNSTVPTITGTAQAGQTLTASTGTWANSPTSFTYQWNKGGAAVSGATSNVYAPTDADVGSTFTVTVTALNSGGSASATSAATSAVIASAVPLHSAGVAGYAYRFIAADLTGTEGTAFTSWPARTGTALAVPTGSAGTVAPTVHIESGERMARFDGVDDQLSLVNGGNLASGVDTIAVVIRSTAASGTSRPLFGTVGGTFSRNATGGMNTTFTGGTTDTIAVDTTNQYRVMIVVGQAATKTVQVDGVSHDVTGNTTSINKNIQLGRSNSSAFGPVDVMEVIAWGSALDATQRAAVRQAMLDRYGALLSAA